MVKNRIKYIRKDKLGKTQTQLGLELGVSRDVISNIELGRVDPPDTFIQLFCMKFNIDEHWLRTGEGEMFIGTDDSLIDNLAAEYKMSEKQKKIIAAFAAMNDKKRETLAEAFFEFIDLVSNTPEIAATIATRPAASDKKLTRAQKEELMKQQLDLEEKEAALLASTTINGLDGEKLA